MLNRVTLIGNLGRDPEVRRLENGTAVGKFTVATNESYKDANGEYQQLTEWHDVVVWRNNAEYSEKFLKKGSMVFIEGKITHRKYTDKTGIERYSTEIVANTCRAFEKRESSGRDAGFPEQEPPYYANRSATNSNVSTSSDATKNGGFEVVPEHEMTDAPSMEGGNDLPF